MRTWTSIFLVVAAGLAAIIRDGSWTVALLLGRITVATIVVAVLLYGTRILVLQMAEPCYRHLTRRRSAAPWVPRRAHPVPPLRRTAAGFRVRESTPTGEST